MAEIQVFQHFASASNRGNTETYTTAQSSLSAMENEISSCTVKSGRWLLYNDVNFDVNASNPVVNLLNQGSYPTPQAMAFPNDQISSLRPVSNAGICLFEKDYYRGEMVVVPSDAELSNAVGFTFKSAIVVSGEWNIYANTDTTGSSCLLGVGDYPYLHAPLFNQSASALQHADAGTLRLTNAVAPSGSGGGSTTAAGSTGSANLMTIDQAYKTYVDILLDVSGSMGGNKIETAKNALIDVVNGLLNIQVALRAFGTVGCNSELYVPLAPLSQNRNTIIQKIRDITNPAGSTPIASAISLVPDDLTTIEAGSKLTLLVTDGDENCGGHPKQAISDLRSLKDAQGNAYEIRTNIVGLEIRDQTTKDKFQSWADAGGGRYYDAGNAGQFKASIEEALAIRYTVMDLNTYQTLDGVEGFVGGPEIPLKPGNYLVQLQLEGRPMQNQKVQISSGAESVISVERA